MKRLLLVLVLLAIVTAIGWSIRATLCWEDATRAIAEINGRADALRTRIKAADDRLKRAGDAGRGLEKQLADANVPAAPAAPPAPRKLSPETIIANDPVKMAAYSRDFRMSLDVKYGAMIKALGLSAERWERFKDFTLWREQRRIDVLAAVENHGLKSYSAEYTSLMQKDASETKQKALELLGDDNKRIRDYYMESNLKQHLRQLSAQLASAGYMYPETPIGLADVERVTQLLAETNSSKRNPDGSFKQAPLDWGKLIPQLKLPPTIVQAMQHWEMGLNSRIMARSNEVIAPLNAALPEEKRHESWELWIIEPVVPATPPSH